MLLRGAKRGFIPLLVAALGMSGFAAVDQPYEVGTWGDFAKGAVSFTFDDNTPNQIKVAQPMFDEKGFHMTMFIVINWGPDWANYKKAHAAGHEIGSHSISHPSTMPSSEAKSSQDSIKINVPGEMAVSVAYPNCTVPSDINTFQKYYIVGRTCFSGNGIATKSPSDFFKVSSQICGSQGYNSTSQLTGFADQAASSEGWGVYLCHGIETEPSGASDYSPVNPTALQGCIDYLDKNRDKVWVETMGNVARYIRERDAVTVTEKKAGTDTVVVTVSDNLADSIFNFPLSIRRPLPDNWETAYVSQDEQPVEDTIVTVNSKKYVMFKAVPDGGDVVITKNIPTGIRMRSAALSDGSSSPVRLEKNMLVIASKNFNNAAVEVTLFGLSGKLISRYSLSEGVSQLRLSGEALSQSVFIADVSGGGVSWRGTLIAGR